MQSAIKCVGEGRKPKNNVIPYFYYRSILGLIRDHIFSRQQRHFQESVSVKGGSVSVKGGNRRILTQKQ